MELCPTKTFIPSMWQKISAKGSLELELGYEFFCSRSISEDNVLYQFLSNLNEKSLSYDRKMIFEMIFSHTSLTFLRWNNKCELKGP